MSDEYLSVLFQEMQLLLSKGAIERVPDSERGGDCYSHYFLVPKKDVGLTPILDLRSPNLVLQKEKF